MNIYTSSVRHPVAVTVLLLAVMVMAFIYAPKLNIESFPKIDVPAIAISTVYQGAGPEEIEDQITIPMEEAVGSVGNIEEIESSSSEGLSVVVVRFFYGTNMETATADVREKIDRIKRDLPTGSENPVVSKADPADKPVVRLAMTSGTGDMRRLRSIATNDIRKELEKIAGIASVKVSGGEERAIAVRVDRNRLEALSIPVNAVTAAIARENNDIPSGRITASNLEFGVRSIGQMKSVDDFRNILVGTANGKPVYLKDVAVVEDSAKEVRTRTRSNGKPCVTLEVKKNTDANTVVVADEVKKAMEKINKELPPGFSLSLAYDQSTFVRDNIKNLEEMGYEGAILAAIFILIFLGSMRSTLIVSLSVPFSVIATFLLMYFGGLTINMMTLVGFILAVGNIVDCSIVVLENIFRHLEEGKDLYSAAIDGTTEVGGAVLGGTVTAIIVFVPIMLLKGLAGQIFTPLAKTYCFALFCSYVAAITIVPMVSAKFLGKELENRHKGFMGVYNKWWEGFFGWVTKIYTRMLGWALSHRFQVIVIAILTLATSLFLAKFLRVSMTGQWDRGDFLVQIETPIGSSLDRTEKVVNDVEKYLLETYKNENDSVITDLGQSAAATEGAGSTSGSSPRFGGFTVTLIPRDKRKISMYEIMDRITDKYKDYVGAKVTVNEVFSMSGKKPLEIQIRGNDLAVLEKTANELKAKLQSVEGLKNLDLNYRPGSPEYKIKVDRQKAAMLGLGTGQISQVLRMMLAEDKVSSYRENGNEYDIFVQLPELQRDSIEKVESLKLVTPMGKQVALKEIAEIIPSSAPSSIPRKDRSRYIAVTADLTSGKSLSEVMTKVTPILNATTMPTGYTWSIAGDEKKRIEMFGDLFQALFLSIVFVYVFLALQFESFLHPLTIMLSIPLELAGVFGALIITNQMLTIFALLGIIMLVGIVVNHTIVLVDYIILRRHAGMGIKEAVMEAAPLRLRPVIMTTGAAILGMIPLALGMKAGAEMFQPLAIGAIGGLTTSTMLTLLVVPTVFTLFEGLTEKFSKKKVNTKSESETTL
ncbi:MAG: efflux RND transporter permease subunit [Firmicutes bacterium]|nr:efflux RND transporter permease subunit [Bacillota bacterium]